MSSMKLKFSGVGASRQSLAEADSRKPGWAWPFLSSTSPLKASRSSKPLRVLSLLAWISEQGLMLLTPVFNSSYVRAANSVLFNAW